MGLLLFHKDKPKQSHHSTSKVSRFLCMSALPQPFSPVRHQVFPSDHTQLPFAGWANLGFFSDTSVWAPAALKLKLALLETHLCHSHATSSPVLVASGCHLCSQGWLDPTACSWQRLSLPEGPTFSLMPENMSYWVTRAVLDAEVTCSMTSCMSWCLTSAPGTSIPLSALSFTAKGGWQPSLVFSLPGWGGRCRPLCAPLELPSLSSYSPMSNPLPALAEFPLLEHHWPDSYTVFPFSFILVHIFTENGT